MQISEDLKNWYAIACPTTGVRFDLRTLELMDADHDGRVRSPEVKAALEYLKAKGVSLDDLANPSEEDEKKLADVLKRQAELDKAEPSELEKTAMTEWEAKGKTPEVAILGDATAAAEASLAAIEKTVVWNPGPEGKMPDFEPDDWKKFVCVEPVSDWPGGGTLEPGATHELLAAIQSTLE